MILTATFLSAFAGAGLILLLPERSASLARWIALLAALAGLGFATSAFLHFDNAGPHFQFLTNIPWIPQLGISFSTGADGISLVMLVLTGLIAVTGVLFSWNVTHRTRAFFAFFLTIIGGVYGVFQSFDLFLLFVFYEIVIIPKYFLIAAWGSTNREYGAMKLTMYSVAGSALVLLVMVAAYAASGAHSFDLFTLADPTKAHFAPGFQAWAFPVMFLGFAVLAGIWPLHTWAPTGHVAAPTAVSMLLAGVVMKLGSYSALRVAMTIFPAGLDQWRLPIAILATAGIVLGALVALAQKDLKFTVGYSSIAHMGFVLLGLMTLNLSGLGGSVLQMFSHGIIGGLLFAVVGRMIYDRTHTRDIAELGSMNLTKALPFAAFTFTVASVASMGLPGFSGFIAEFTILKGSWTSLPWLLVPTGIGVVITVAFTLRALQRTFFPAGESSAPAHPLDPITLPEKLGAVILMAATLAVGLFPSVLLDPILRSFQSPLMHQLLK
ncbi:MAG: NADH-quinone oxidoreductase subunit M [Verrucomicrobiaceae bacterium]|nr:MAG: NADH-quinone oxidoreductase subunit M [Verrucomicrobiaceae bacterium]